jgi:8-oxo-dGTP pyrophosphatase MutT (NUDIX family)
MPESNPWKTLSTKHIYTNPWITVREDQVIRPDGSEGIYGVVDTRIASAVVALTPENEVYLVGQFRYTTDVYSWEVIAGGGEKNEDPLVTAKRELKEEAGITAQTWTTLSENIQMSNCYTSEIGYIYLARDLEISEPEPDDTEELLLKKIPLEDALAQIDSGEITDAFSIIALHRTQRWIDSNV